MKIKYLYSKRELDATVKFISLHNPSFTGQDELIKNSILSIIFDLNKKFPDGYWSGTMGFIVKAEIMSQESMDEDENAVYYSFLVDPALGLSYQLSDKEIEEDSFERTITIK